MSAIADGVRDGEREEGGGAAAAVAATGKAAVGRMGEQRRGWWKDGSGHRQGQTCSC